MNAAAVLTRDGLDELVRALVADGYRVIGPTVRDDAIVLAEIDVGRRAAVGLGRRDRARALPAAPPRRRGRVRALGGRRSPGSSSCTRRGSRCGHGRRRRVHRRDRGAGPLRLPRRARLRPRRDRHARHRAGRRRARRRRLHPPPRGPVRRSPAGCTEPGGVCFCASMGTGPAPGPGYDLALTERIDDDGHRFVVDVGTGEGERVLARLTPPRRDATARSTTRAPPSTPPRDRMGRTDAGRRPAPAAARQPRVPDLGGRRRNAA